MNLYKRVGKDILDACLTIPAAFLAVPVLSIIGFLVRLKMGNPIMFSHIRIGKGGKSFSLFKFRTMMDMRDSKGNLLPDEERLTGLGRFLRSTSLDELPEIINVLRGEMSLVGPRPLLPQYLDRYSSEQLRRHEVKPGITGWAQINGRNELSWEDKFVLDVWYVDNVSLLLDLRILALTTIKVIKREGISPKGHETMPEFLGNNTRR